MSNQNNLAVYGLKFEIDIIGRTVFDMSKIMGKGWPKGFPEKIHEDDQRIVQFKKPIMNKDRKFLNKAGFVVIHSILKMPVFSKNEKVTGILTFSFDSTRAENIFSLKSIYDCLYAHDANIGNIKFMEFIGFEQGIQAKLSKIQMDALLSKCQYIGQKSAANHLGKSPKTLEKLLAKAKEKLGVYNINIVIE